MATVGTIAVDIVANTGKLAKPLAAAGGSIRSFTGGLTSSVAGMGAFIGGIGAAIASSAALAVAYSKVNAQFEEVDAIAKSADRLGLATEEMVGLRHAAALAGVSNEQLQTSLERMVKGGGDVRQLGEVADKLAGMTDPAERLRFALDTFGKGGAGMVNLLAGGSAELQKMQADAEKLGLTFSRGEAANVESFNDNLTRLGELFTGIARKVAIELAPFLDFVVSSLVDMGTQGEGMGGMVRGAMDLVIDGIGLVLDGVDLMIDAWNLVRAAALTYHSFVIQALAHITKGIEIAVETVATGFRWAFAQAQQVVSEAVSGMINLLSQVASWIESKLPERFRLGIGNAATEFATAFEQTVEQQRAALESKSFAVDLTFGDTAMEFADAFSAQAAQARDDFMQGVNRESLSDKLRRNVEQIRADAEMAAADAVTTPEVDDLAAAAKTPAVAALERGSNAAFSAFQQAASKDPAKEQLDLQRKSEQHLARIAKSGIILAGANL